MGIMDMTNEQAAAIREVGAKQPPSQVPLTKKKTMANQIGDKAAQAGEFVRPFMQPFAVSPALAGQQAGDIVKKIRP